MNSRRKTVLRLLGVAVVVLAGAAVSWGDLLVNIDFEDGKSVGTTITTTTNRGTLGGNTTGTCYTAGAATYTARPRGARRDRAANFVANGGNIAFTVPAGVVAVTSDWTYMATVYVGDGNATFNRLLEPFISMVNGDPAYDLSVATSSGSAGTILPDSTYGFRTNWHHVAVTSDYDGSGNTNRQYARVYVDGVLVASAPFGVRFDYSVGVTIGIGDRKGTSAYRPFYGGVDDVRFYNELVSSNDVHRAYLDSFFPPRLSGAVISFH